MSELKASIAQDSELPKGLVQRCLTFLRCWPLPELRQLEIASEVLRRVLQISPTKGVSIEDQAISELRQQVAREVMADDLPATPRLNRGQMVAEPLDRTPYWNFLKNVVRRQARRVTSGQGATTKDASSSNRTVCAQEAQHRPWRRVAGRRRLLLALLVFAPALLAAWGVSTVLPFHGATPVEKMLIFVSGLLFAWVSVGFWVALFGFVSLLRKKSRFLLGRTEAESLPTTIAKGTRTAILFPICGEEMSRVGAGVHAVYQSLKKTGQMAAFDFYLLSDSSDPDDWVNEEVAWRQLNRDLGDPGNLFYRRRKVNLKRKSGNIADFCRRFGKSYRYMVVMDADSVMAGKTLTQMVQLMEHHPHVGILQTPPAVVGRETLLARIQQFSSRAYGPLFAAGLHCIQLGDASFWGHNAILRIEPFMAHCGLGRLPGKAPWGGDILSHDFVESALMRRAGWSVWLAHDLGGSYEECPPTLLDELKRDRRWCCGNLQHLRLVFTRGFSGAHRWLFFNGIMSYASALFWLGLLVLSTTEVVLNAFRVPEYFPKAQTLFPQWPVWDPFGPAILLAVTAILLFLPKILAVATILLQGRSKQFGGFMALLASLVGECLMSAFLAPIRMLFHSRFVLSTLLGKVSGWGSQARDDRGTPWHDACRFHLGSMMLALVWGGLVWLMNPDFFVWMLPILIPWLLAIPLSVVTSRSSWGRLTRRLRLFLIPEETAPPAEMESMARKQRELTHGVTPLRVVKTCGFIRAVLNPQINALHRRLLAKKARAKGSADRRFFLVRKALSFGPEGLSTAEKLSLLKDGLAMWMLHKEVWTLTDDRLAPKWFGRYTHRAP